MAKTEQELESTFAERRAHQRATLRAAVTWNSDSNFYTGITNDISEGGLFVSTHMVCPAGTEMDLEFSLPDSKGPIKVRGTVRWVREYYQYSDAQPGMGLQFIDLGEDDRRRIESFVKVRETLLFED